MRNQVACDACGDLAAKTNPEALVVWLGSTVLLLTSRESDLETFRE
ncbi:MAG: hypothetical protein RMJ19_01250 [Gemmatales bacterium]|nr:hypothetical protein [Gemmatales bacterium]MDW8174273.1 hypothetical protein [Gemmatales bacterium]